jgi:undecaprenyl-diphosphatase
VNGIEPGRLGRWFAVAAGGAALFAALAMLVWSGWAPLLAMDRTVVADLNAAVAPHPVLVHALSLITTLGSARVLFPVVVAVAVFLLVRRRFALAAFLAVTSLGASVLDPEAKALVGRARPVVAEPIAASSGSSYPSGHALDSLICYGAVVLVVLPILPRRARGLVLAGAAAVLGLVGASRVLLGVHYVTDVIGAWCLGLAWLAFSVGAAEAVRRRAERP